MTHAIWGRLGLKNNILSMQHKESRYIISTEHNLLASDITMKYMMNEGIEFRSLLAFGQVSQAGVCFVPWVLHIYQRL